MDKLETKKFLENNSNEHFLIAGDGIIRFVDDFLEDFTYRINTMDEPFNATVVNGHLKIDTNEDTYTVIPLDEYKTDKIIDQFMFKEFGPLWTYYTVPSKNKKLNELLFKDAAIQFKRAL